MCPGRPFSQSRKESRTCLWPVSGRRSGRKHFRSLGGLKLKRILGRGPLRSRKRQ